MHNGRVDESLMQPGVPSGLQGVPLLLNGYSEGTTEVKNLLSYECDVIMECRICRNLFRSLPSFVAHKRIYCKETANKYVDEAPKFQLEEEEEDPLERPERPTSTKSCPAIFEGGANKIGIDAIGQNRDKEIIPKKDLASSLKPFSSSFVPETRPGTEIQQRNASKLSLNFLSRLVKRIELSNNNQNSNGNGSGNGGGIGGTLQPFSMHRFPEIVRMVPSTKFENGVQVIREPADVEKLSSKCRRGQDSRQVTMVVPQDAAHRQHAMSLRTRRNFDPSLTVKEIDEEDLRIYQRLEERSMLADNGKGLMDAATLTCLIPACRKTFKRLSTAAVHVMHAHANLKRDDKPIWRECALCEYDGAKSCADLRLHICRAHRLTLQHYNEEMSVTKPTKLQQAQIASISRGSSNSTTTSGSSSNAESSRTFFNQGGVNSSNNQPAVKQKPTKIQKNDDNFGFTIDQPGASKETQSSKDDENAAALTALNADSANNYCESKVKQETEELDGTIESRVIEKGEVDTEANSAYDEQGLNEDQIEDESNDKVSGKASLLRRSLRSTPEKYSDNASVKSQPAGIPSLKKEPSFSLSDYDTPQPKQSAQAATTMREKRSRIWGVVESVVAMSGQPSSNLRAKRALKSPYNSAEFVSSWPLRCGEKRPPGSSSSPSPPNANLSREKGPSAASKRRKEETKAPQHPLKVKMQHKDLSRYRGSFKKLNMLLAQKKVVDVAKLNSGRRRPDERRKRQIWSPTQSPVSAKKPHLQSITEPDSKKCPPSITVSAAESSFNITKQTPLDISDEKTYRDSVALVKIERPTGGSTSNKNTGAYMSIKPEKEIIKVKASSASAAPLLSTPNVVIVSKATGAVLGKPVSAPRSIVITRNVSSSPVVISSTIGTVSTLTSKPNNPLIKGEPTKFVSSPKFLVSVKAGSFVKPQVKMFKGNDGKLWIKPFVPK